MAGFLVKGDWWEMEAASVGQSQRAEWKSMRFHGKCQPGLTFWRLQPPESGGRGGGRTGNKRGGGRGGKKEIRVKKKMERKGGNIRN